MIDRYHRDHLIKSIFTALIALHFYCVKIVILFHPTIRGSPRLPKSENHVRRGALEVLLSCSLEQEFNQSDGSRERGNSGENQQESGKTLLGQVFLSLR